MLYFLCSLFTWSDRLASLYHLPELVSFFQHGRQSRHVRLRVTAATAAATEKLGAAGGVYAHGAVQVRMRLGELQGFPRLLQGARRHDHLIMFSRVVSGVRVRKQINVRRLD